MVLILKWKELHNGKVWFTRIKKIKRNKTYNFLELWGPTEKSITAAIRSKNKMTMIPLNDRGIVELIQWPKAK